MKTHQCKKKPRTYKIEYHQYLGKDAKFSCWMMVIPSTIFNTGVIIDYCPHCGKKLPIPNKEV